MSSRVDGNIVILNTINSDRSDKAVASSALLYTKDPSPCLFQFLRHSNNKQCVTSLHFSIKPAPGFSQKVETTKETARIKPRLAGDSKSGVPTISQPTRYNKQQYNVV
jgi:hypothetical protein